MPNLYSFALAPVLMIALTAPAIAQETTPAQPAAQNTANREGVISYTPADFADARPNTALDMIARLPGFTLIAGDQVRGFAGAAGNVLIDGQRPTSKTDNLQDIIGRIPIDQVERIDVIRGGAAGIDMQGQTVVANVIRKNVDTFQQVLAASGLLFMDTGHTIPGWSYQATRRWGEHQLDFSLSRGQSYDDSVGHGWRTTDFVNGAPIFERSETEADGLVHTGRINYKGPQLGGTVSANALLSTDEFKDEEHFFEPASDQRFVSRSHNDRGEIGLNYLRPLGDFEMELIGLSKLAKGEGFNSAHIISTPGTIASEFRVEAEAGESIGRGILRYRPSTKLSFEGGGEVAFNYREQSVSLITQENNDPPVRITLPAADVRIEELRSEAFVQGTWRPTDKLSFEAGIRYEQSKITESGDVSLEREFTYPKPRFVATWSPTKTDQLRVRIEREIGQLNFQDFISNVNLSSNVLSAGNAQLEPDKTWSYEAAYEKRFWGNGALVVTYRHEDISDVVDNFPFLVNIDANNDGVPDDVSPADGIPDTRLVAGPGNIGDGQNDILQFNLTIPLEKFGDKGGEIKINTTLQDGRVTDPLTHEERRISGLRWDNINASFRQDMPEQKLTFGLNYFGGWSERRFFLEEQDNLDLRDAANIFIEWKPTPKFTLRAELNNISPYKFTIQRLVYDGPRGTGNLDYIETERRVSQIIGMLRGRWTIG